MTLSHTSTGYYAPSDAATEAVGMMPREDKVLEVLADLSERMPPLTACRRAFAPYMDRPVVRPRVRDSDFDPCAERPHVPGVLTRLSVFGLRWRARHCLRCGSQLGPWMAGR